MKYTMTLFALFLALGVFSAAAQESMTHTVAFDGFGFDFDPALAANVNITQYPGDPAEIGPGFAEPPFTQFALYNEFPVPESVLDAVGGVRVYRTADFAGYTEHESRLQQLQTLLDERPDLAAYMMASEDMNQDALPFIPVFPAGQVIRARAQVVDTPAVMGISYVTIYQQAAEPFLSDSFIYTFQGVSADGAYYVSAIFNLTTELFPAELPTDYDPDAFLAQMQAYFEESIAQLSAAAPDDFTPSLTTLDALIQSFAAAE